MIEALFCGAIPIVGHHRLLPFTMAAAVGQSCSHTPSLLCVALAEDITRQWRQNMSRYLAETQLSAMFQARVSFLAYSQLKPLSLMPFWASSSINEPMSAQNLTDWLDVHSIFVMQK